MVGVFGHGFGGFSNTIKYKAALIEACNKQGIDFEYWFFASYRRLWGYNMNSFIQKKKINLWIFNQTEQYNMKIPQNICDGKHIWFNVYFTKSSNDHNLFIGSTVMIQAAINKCKTFFL